MKNSKLRKLLALTGIAAVALTTLVTPSNPSKSNAASETVIPTLIKTSVKAEGYSMAATSGHTFVNYSDVRIAPGSGEGYFSKHTTDGSEPSIKPYTIAEITKTSTVKVKCVKDGSDKAVAKRLKTTEVHTYKYNVIETGLDIQVDGQGDQGAFAHINGVDVFEDDAYITIGYPGKAINRSKGGLYFYKDKNTVTYGKYNDGYKGGFEKRSTKKYDKKYAKLKEQDLYYTLDGSTPTTKSKKIKAGFCKEIEFTKPGYHTIKMMGALERKVYTYTFYVDTPLFTSYDLGEKCRNNEEHLDAAATFIGYQMFNYKWVVSLVDYSGNTKFGSYCVELKGGETLSVPCMYTKDTLPDVDIKWTEEGKEWNEDPDCNQYWVRVLNPVVVEVPGLHL